MRDTAGWRVLSVDGVDGHKYLIACEVDSEDPDGSPQEQGEAIWNIGLTWPPDLTDPATLGCLLALVREAWGIPGAYFRHGWIFNDNGGSPEDDDIIAGENGMPEAEALVDALETAP